MDTVYRNYYTNLVRDAVAAGVYRLVVITIMNLIVTT